MRLPPSIRYGYPHDVLIGLHQLVAYLHGELQRQFGSLESDHRIVHVAAAVDHVGDGGVGGIGRRLGGLDQARQRFAEPRGGRAGGALGAEG